MTTQAQGAVERYKRTIKDLFKTTFIEYENKGLEFDIKNELIKCLNIYNSTKHSTIGYSPKFIFNCNNKDIYDKVHKNTLKSQMYKKFDSSRIIENKFGLLCENFQLLSNNIKKNVFGNKGKYKIPIFIIKSSSPSEYEIKLSFDYKNLKKDKSYHSDFTLLKLYDEKTYMELIKNYIN